MTTRHGTLHPRNAPTGFVDPRNTAWPHAGYEGAYTFCGYWRTWDKILGAKDGEWKVQQVDNAGTPIGEVRKHRTSIDLRLVYPAPFDPWR